MQARSQKTQYGCVIRPNQGKRTKTQYGCVIPQIKAKDKTQYGCVIRPNQGKKDKKTAGWSIGHKRADLFLEPVARQNRDETALSMSKEEFQNTPKNKM